MGTAGLSTLLYLEVLDASFSFDGVIGAFAIRQNVLVIAAGLGIRALFVRSMTVQLVPREHWCSTATSSTALPGRAGTTALCLLIELRCISPKPSQAA